MYSRKDGNAGQHGVNDLVEDVKSHFNSDFLYREIALIGKKKHSFIPPDEYEDKNTQEEYYRFLDIKKYWFNALEQVEQKKAKLQDFLDSVTVPLVCTYQSRLFEKYDDETVPEFIQEYEEEMLHLKKVFKERLSLIEEENGEPIKTDLNILLILFPIPDKKQLLKILHRKLYNQQNA